jgi:type II secretory pathway component PulM
MQVNALKTLGHRWSELSGRERTLVALAAAVVALFFAWSVLFKPALSALAAAPGDMERARATLERLQALAAQASALRGSGSGADAQATPQRTMESGVDDATRSQLKAALGDGAKLEVQGRFITISFEGASGEQVRQALRMLRSRLRAQLIEAELRPEQEGISGRLRFEWTAT